MAHALVPGAMRAWAKLGKDVTEVLDYVPGRFQVTPGSLHPIGLPWSA
jgi:hypothetical protein